MWKYISLALFSTVNFMFGPMLGPTTGLGFWETFFTVLAGGYLSAVVFYFGSSYFIERSMRLYIKKMEKAEENGKELSKKSKRFTKTNRRIITIKQRVNKYFIFWAFPLFLSIPGGCVIVAKFYKHQRKTFPLILLFLMLDCLVITIGSYYVSGFTS